MKYVGEEIDICLDHALHEIRRNWVDFINIYKTSYIGPLQTLVICFWKQLLYILL